MKFFSGSILAIGLITLSGAVLTDEDVDANGGSLKSKEARFSYFLGNRDVANFQAEGLTIDLEAFRAGVMAAKAGVESIVDQEEAKQLGEYFTAQIQQKKQDELTQALKRSDDFLAENALKEGVKTTESGLQYKVLETAEGEMPTAESTVQVHYEGRLISGDVFDSSYVRGAPVEFPLSGVIAGWTEGLQLMPEGSKYELYIPSDLAYGSQGTRSIGPNEALIFVVELIQANYLAE